jgi:hypothetical protein
VFSATVCLVIYYYCEYLVKIVLTLTHVKALYYYIQKVKNAFTGIIYLRGVFYEKVF